MLELGVPGMLAAGLALSPHCSLMCGAVQRLALPPSRRSLWRALLPLHAGRVAGYASFGALAGGSGPLLTRALPSPALGLGLQLAGAALLIVFGIRQLRRRVPACCGPKPAPGVARQFVAGLGWALLPCAQLYFALSAAALAGSARHGGALLAAFAIGGSPLLAASGYSFAGMDRLRQAPGLAAALMIGVGLVGFVASALLPLLHPAWCLPR
ncbi:sulfite exporter TauE/SafE family protein [Solimonas soli]|uniref:sulfite exporter TauE/SafE family protein n=1 Tax=Solimonas soli TaxID=413479 RepID=UPI0004831411|nr:sulfite exporter TauE/SafE family protein [Solimonas soli]